RAERTYGRLYRDSNIRLIVLTNALLANSDRLGRFVQFFQKLKLCGPPEGGKGFRRQHTISPNIFRFNGEAERVFHVMLLPGITAEPERDEVRSGHQRYVAQIAHDGTLCERLLIAG